MQRSRLKRLCALFACLQAPLFAQVNTGSINGTVTDPNGAVVPAAKITARQETTGQVYETITTDAGLYVLPTLAVGPYTLTVEKTGFKKLARENLEVRIAARLTVDLQLEVGDVVQTVEITDTAPLLESTTSERGQNFSSAFMSNLPLFTGGIRSPRSFVSYMPGVNAGGEVSISGTGGRAQEVLIDGASLTIPESGGTVFNFPSAEIFGEFKLLTGTYSAEYGRFGGGVEIYVTKSGTNWIHGTAFHNMRRDIWNANSWANNSLGRERPKERFNEVGGAIGGPVFVPKLYDGRNKTFWFFTYTKDLRPASIANVVSTVPTALMKQGNFSELGSQLIYDPATTRPDPNNPGQFIRDPFPGNIIPQNRFSTVARNLIPLVPDPNASRLAQNYNFVNQTTIDKYIWSLKFDHAFTDNNRLSFWMSREQELRGDITNFPGPIGNGLGEQTQKPYNYRFNHDWTLSPTFLMHTTVGISATRQGWDNPAQFGYGSQLGLPGIPAEADAMPRILFRGPAGLSPYGVQDGKVANGGQNNDTLMLSQGYSWLRGKHEFKFGWDTRFLKTEGFDYAGGNGRYYFNRLQTGVPNSTSGSGHEFASLLLGAVDEADNTVLPVLFPTIHYQYIAGYFQDNWKVTRNLTLNLGLRYEVPVNWHASNGDYSSIDLSKPNPGAGNLPGALVFAGQGAGRTGQDYFWPTDYSNIGPRAGFAYQIASKTVLRGGFGIYYQTLGNGGCGCREGFANSNAVSPQGFNPAFNWDSGIPVAGGYRPPPVLDPSWGNFKNVDFMGPTFGKAPRVYNWSFNIQQEVKNFLFDIAYVGNRAYRLNSTIELNQLPTNLLSLGSLLTQSINSPAVQEAGFSAPFEGFGNRNLNQALRPYPQFLSLSSRNAGVGRTWYDSLQAKVERRFGAFQLMAAYTFSKSLGRAHYRQIFSQGAQVAPQDAYNIEDAKTYLPFDQTHVLNILSTYELPFGRGKKFLGSTSRFVDILVGGWTLSGAQRYYSGNLLQVVTPGNPLGSTIFAANTKAMRNNVPIRTDFSRGDLDPNNPSARWFNAGAFSAAPAFSLGNASFYYGDFRQPPIFIENVSIAKRTTLWENERNPVVLTYRADAFNLFNRTNFGGIVGTVGNANFGRPTAAQQGPRLITMGLRLDF
jgi:hypothetical protein